MMDTLDADRSPWAVFKVFLRLGLTSFGGPMAHLGYFRHEFVQRRRWLSERSFVDLVALCQFLPGPASSQIGMALGLSRAGYAGALAAWAGFTLPSAVALILLAIGVASDRGAVPAGVLHGLGVVTVAVVAQAVWGMARHLCTDVPRVLIMLAAAGAALAASSAVGQVGIIAVAAVLGVLLFKPQPEGALDALHVSVGCRAGAIWLGVFVALLLVLPALASVSQMQALALADAFYRAGALVFGGGHVVLPLLQAEVVPPGWVSNEAFLAGYGAAQAVPGPLFSFAAFLGAAMSTPPTGWLGGMLCLVAVFAPSFLLVVGMLPFWEHLRRNTRARAALSGINAAVVGLLLAALYQPVWVNAIHHWPDAALAALAWAALAQGRLPPWLIVIASGLAGWGLTSASPQPHPIVFL